MERCHILSTISGLSLALLLWNGIFVSPAQAGRPVLNQTTQTIQRYFGSYKTRLRTNDGITYAYVPATFKRLFPKFPKSNLSIIFVNNRAKKITLNFNGSYESFQETYNYARAAATKFYNYIFGYQLAG